MSTSDWFGLAMLVGACLLGQAVLPKPMPPARWRTFILSCIVFMVIFWGMDALSGPLGLGRIGSVMLTSAGGVVSSTFLYRYDANRQPPRDG